MLDESVYIQILPELCFYHQFGYKHTADYSDKFIF